MQEIGERELERSPRRLISERKQELKLLHLQLMNRMQSRRDQVSNRKQVLAEKLDSLSPLAVLKRGYSICRHLASGRLIQSSRAVKEGDLLEVILGEGSLNCQVNKVVSQQGTQIPTAND